MKPLPRLLIVGVILLAWSNSFSGPFHFDDNASIVDNRSIRQLWPATWLHPPAGAGETVGGRPVLNFTFALNHAVGGLDPRSYHVVNLAIHVLAALTLFGVVRRTLAFRPTLVSPAHVLCFATAVTLLWAVHPLQVESVTYIVQRAESLAGLFSLLTLYCFVRGVEGRGSKVDKAEGVAIGGERAADVRGSFAALRMTSATQSPALDPRRSTFDPTFWFVLAFLACLLGIGTKETVAVVPVLVLLYDWVFVGGSWREVWRKRRGVHLALLATWLPLGWLVLRGGGRGGTFAFTVAGFVGYWVAQLKAITWYLWLTVWPSPLVFDRAFFRLEHIGEISLYAVVVFGLLGAAMHSLRRRTVTGFLGANFFILLAPTSLMPGTLQVIVEHRMYLALIAPVVLTLAWLWRMSPRPALGIAGAAILALSIATFARNRVYSSELRLWEDTVAKAPDNPRAHYNHGVALAREGRAEEARAEFENTLALQPNHAFARFQLGKAALLQRDWARAAEHFAVTVEIDPRYVDARVNLGQALGELGRVDEAIAQYEAALALEPEAADVRTNLGAALATRGRWADAETLLRAAIAANPELAEAHFHLGNVLLRRDVAAAETEFATATRLRPDFIAAHLALGNLRAKQQRFDVAMDAYLAALRVDPHHLQARNNLANCQLVTGRFAEAIANYEAVLRDHPNDPTATRNLALAREQVR